MDKTSQKQNNSVNNRKIFKYRSLAPLWISVFIDIIGFSLILPLAPYFQILFNTTTFMMGIVLSVNAMFTFVFGPILGKLSDKFGRRPLLLLSQLGTFIGFLMLAFSNSLEMLVISRIIDGIFGGNFPIAKAIISDEVPHKDRSFQMANIGVAHVLASLIGPGLGGTLFTIGGILAPGLFAAGLSLFTMFITIALLKETWSKSKRVQMHEMTEKVDIKLRENRKAMFYLTLFGFHTVSFTITIASLSFFGALVFGLTPFETGMLMLISGIIRVIIRFSLFKPTIVKLGEDIAIQLGLTIFVIIFFLIGFSINVIMLLIIVLFLSFAASITRGPLNSKISKSVSPKIQGKINGYSSALDSFAQIVGPLIGTFMLQFFEPYWLGIVIASIAFVPFVMGFTKIESRKNIMKKKKIG